MEFPGNKGRNIDRHVNIKPLACRLLELALDQEPTTRKLLEHLLGQVFLKMVYFSVNAALAALSFFATFARASPVLSAEVDLATRQASGYKNIVYFTNWSAISQRLVLGANELTRNQGHLRPQLPTGPAACIAAHPHPLRFRQHPLDRRGLFVGHIRRHRQALRKRL